MIAAIDRKLLRDLVRMRGQLLAIAVVIACGIGVFVAMRSTMRSLESARSTYYGRQQFADVFAGLKRAPEHVAGELRRIGGVRELETRVVADVTLDVPGMTEAAIGRLVSIPDRRMPRVNGLLLRSGRLPEPGRGYEVVVNEPFLVEHGFELGTEISALINGKRERLRIVGSALAPEFTYVTPPGQLLPDDRRLAIVWMRRGTLGPAFDMDGAFNDVSLLLTHGEPPGAVVAQVDAVLERFGGLGAVLRRDQASAFFVENELAQLRTFALMLPVLFLAVAAFLLNTVIGRIVSGQREQIAALKALGYRDREVGWHYAKIAAVVVGVGMLAGIALGAWLGSGMTGIYVEYYRFPELPFELGMREAAQALFIAAVAALIGAWAAVSRTVRLPPAEALRPAAPPVYRPTLVERLGFSRLVPPAARMVMRELERKPLRAAMTVSGIAMAIALAVVNAFSFDSVRHMINVQFGLGQRNDVLLTLYEPRATSAVGALAHLPGVVYAEPHRNVPVRLRAGPRTRTGAITGLRRDARLYQVLDVALQPVVIPGDGLVLSRKLAEVLEVAVGDRVGVEILEGARPRRWVPVARICETFVGMSAHMELAALCRVLGETESMNGAWLEVDDGRLPELHRAVKDTPVIAGISSRDTALRHVREILDENLGTWVTISLAFSLVLAFGVLYNSVRITLAERQRDLASLRVLGFRRSEVAGLLLGELGLLTLVATPLGLWLGHGLAALLVASPGFDSEQFRLPLVIAPGTYALAVASVLAAAVLSAWHAWRKLDRIDIVEVLKARD